MLTFLVMILCKTRGSMLQIIRFSSLQLTDLLFFVSLVVIFILAYGVINQAMRYPNSPLSFSLLKGIIYQPYWQIYGELFLDQLEGNTQVEVLY